MKATYVSVWDGGTVITTGCDYDPATGDVTNIETSDVDGLENLDDEYVELPDGAQIRLFTIDGESTDDEFVLVPTREVDVEGIPQTISMASVSARLIDEDGDYRFEGAQGIDEQIFFFVDDADFWKTDEELTKIIEESL